MASHHSEPLGPVPAADAPAGAAPASASSLLLSLSIVLVPRRPKAPPLLAAVGRGGSGFALGVLRPCGASASVRVRARDAAPLASAAFRVLGGVCFVLVTYVLASALLCLFECFVPWFNPRVLGLVMLGCRWSWIVLLAASCGFCPILWNCWVILKWEIVVVPSGVIVLVEI